MAAASKALMLAACASMACEDVMGPWRSAISQRVATWSISASSAVAWLTLSRCAAIYQLRRTWASWSRLVLVMMITVRPWLALSVRPSSVPVRAGRPVFTSDGADAGRVLVVG